jgi:mRNA-degrading endonuclease toxin of MazEF toxin-antitoxin module
MRSTTTYRRGHVVVVSVPFTGHVRSKPRPALVFSADGVPPGPPDPIVCPISSQPRFYNQPGGGDHPLKHWKSLGLRYPSTACLSNLMAVEKRLIKRTLSPLHEDDLARIEHGLREVFSL